MAKKVCHFVIFALCAAGLGLQALGRLVECTEASGFVHYAWNSCGENGHESCGDGRGGEPCKDSDCKDKPIRGAAGVMTARVIVADVVGDAEPVVLPPPVVTVEAVLGRGIVEWHEPEWRREGRFREHIRSVIRVV